MAVLLSLGLFAFSMDTLAHQELTRRTEARHATTARIGARDAAQFVGPGQETVSLSGSAVAELGDGAASLDQLRDMQAAGEAHPLVDGTGIVHGDFVITVIDQRNSVLFADGTPRRIDFTIELVRVEDPRT